MNFVDSTDPVLITPTPVYDGEPAALMEIARAMHRAMVDGRPDLRGVGIAAPQVGHAVRMFLMNTRSKWWPDTTVCINPEILEARGKLFEADEGCLTRPGQLWRVARHVDITAAYTNLLGERVRRDLTGINARVFQHELDHLDGVCVWTRAVA